MVVLHQHLTDSQMKFNPLYTNYLYASTRGTGHIISWDTRQMTRPVAVYKRNACTNQRYVFDIHASGKWLICGDVVRFTERVIVGSSLLRTEWKRPILRPAFGGSKSCSTRFISRTRRYLHRISSRSASAYASRCRGVRDLLSRSGSIAERFGVEALRRPAQ